MIFHIINIMVLGFILMFVVLVITGNTDELIETIKTTLMMLAIYLLFCLMGTIIYIIPLSIIYTLNK